MSRKNQTLKTCGRQVEAPTEVPTLVRQVDMSEQFRSPLEKVGGNRGNVQRSIQYLRIISKLNGVCMLEYMTSASYA